MESTGIVLGHRLSDDGSASEILISRLERAIGLYEKGIIERIIVTGGQANKRTSCAEATVMREFLVAHGVEPEKITEEKRSKTTFQNAKFCARILKNLTHGELILITSPEHIRRKYLNPRRLFRLFGMKVDCRYCYEEKGEEND